MNKKKIIKISLLSLLGLVALFLVTVLLIWHNEIASVLSFHEIRKANDAHYDGGTYELTIKGDYYLEDFIAQGGVQNDSELIAFVLKNITKGLIPVKIADPKIGCSSFTATAENGDALFGRNYDMSKTNVCVVHTNPGKGRHASVSTVDLGLLGLKADKSVSSLMDKLTALAAAYAPLDGMNDAGVSCGVYMTYQGGEKTYATNQDTDKPDITSTTFLRLVLDYADSLEEAVEIAEKYDMHDSAGTSYHYMVADSTGRSAIFEWVGETDATDNDGSARKLVVTYNDNDANIGQTEGESNFQWVTNFIIQPGYYDNEADMKGLDRYKKLEELLVNCKGIVKDEKEAMTFLQTVGRRTWNNDDKNSITVHSAIYNMTTKTAYWVPNENYDDPAAWFTFKVGK